MEALIICHGFSKSELMDLEPMTEAINVLISGEKRSINYHALAILESDVLSQIGKTEKVRDFASRVYKKLKQFSS